MLSITATNFGVNPSDIQIKEYHEQNLLVLEGDISVDTTAAEYAGIRYIFRSIPTQSETA